VLTNLVHNAVKFTREGHVSVAVTSEGQKDSTARFHVIVEDTGIGIPENELSLIFDRFTQVDGSSTRRFEGMGLGLAISKQLIDLMGGRIGVTSRSGEGSTFLFTLDLPLAAEPIAASHTVADALSAVQPGPSAARAQPIRARVLVAEDNIVTQKVAARMLENLGCCVDVATNGKDAVEMVRRFPYDLVFMDCLMPELDGFEATGEIRRLEGAERQVPIIAMTALANGGVSQRCLEAGMGGYLTKPVTLGALQLELERWMQAATTFDVEREEAYLPSGATGPSPTDEAVSPALDPEALARLRDVAPDGDDSFLNDLFNAFLNNATTTIELLRQAACAGDAKGLTETAHSLKGSSRDVGARSLADISERLEMLGRNESVAGASELTDEVEREFSRVKDALTT
jgi:CheY-like chemotaxis protein/HPt (histidine-containing phosphotransfer) domain-containing protein